MELIKSLRDPNKQPISEDSLLQITDNKLLLKPNCPFERKVYFFDFISVLRSLGFILSKSNNALGVVLKHNDSKTIKFIFRHIFSLLCVQIDDNTNELVMNFNLQNTKETIVVGFLVHVLINNYGTTPATKAFKRELLQMFIKQVSKALVFQP